MKKIIFSVVAVGLTVISCKKQETHQKPSWWVHLTHQGVKSNYKEEFDIKVFTTYDSINTPSHVLVKNGKEYPTSHANLHPLFDSLARPKEDVKVVTTLQGYKNDTLRTIANWDKFSK